MQNFESSSQKKTPKRIQKFQSESDSKSAKILFMNESFGFECNQKHVKINIALRRWNDDYKNKIFKFFENDNQSSNIENKCETQFDNCEKYFSKIHFIANKTDCKNVFQKHFHNSKNLSDLSFSKLRLTCVNGLLFQMTHFDAKHVQIEIEVVIMKTKNGFFNVIQIISFIKKNPNEWKYILICLKKKTVQTRVYYCSLND